MDDAIREVGDALGRALLARDWNGATAYLAPWLRAEWTPDRVREFVEEQVRLTLEANEVESDHWPEYPEPQVDGNNFVNATKLREPSPWSSPDTPPIPPELTDEMVRYWMQISLVCSDAQMETLPFDSFVEIRAMIVEIPEGLRVGYWKAGDN